MIIADDEKIIRVGLKNLIDWNALGFEIIESFGDGQEIIEYLEYAMPDVIITDIKMIMYPALMWPVMYLSVICPVRWC